VDHRQVPSANSDQHTKMSSSTS